MPPADLERLGPFFAVDVHEPGSDSAAPWRPMAELLDAPALPARVERVRAGLAAIGGLDGDQVEPRVAASVAHLGLVARLVAPAVAADVLGLALDVSSLHDLRWQDELGGALPLSAVARGPIALERVVTGSVTALTEAFRRFGVPSRTAWGNVASALNSAFVQLVAQVPDATARGRATVGRALELPALAAEPSRPGPDFRRRSCCLMYRVAGGRDRSSVCGDCVLTAAPRPA